MIKSFAIIAFAISASFAVQAADYVDSQPAELTAYAKCQLDMPEFDSFDHHIYKNHPRMAACMQLSNEITRDQFQGDIAKFHDFYRDNALAIVMEVKTDYK